MTADDLGTQQSAGVGTRSGNVPWRKSRYGLAAFFLLSLVAMCLALRLVLLIQFGGETGVSAAGAARALIIGLYQDFVVALLATLPLLFWFWVLPNRWFGSKWFRALFLAGFCLFWAVQVFLFCAEYYFFEEFRSRFNTVAVDYLLYPHEVFINIWDSYPVPVVIALCVAAGVAWAWLATRLFRGTWFQPVGRGRRFLHLAGGTALAALLMSTLSLSGTRFSPDRTLNEIANNGSISFVAAAWTHNLDYAAFYRTIPREEAYARVRRLLASPRAEFVEDEFSIRRKVAGDPSRPRLNIVLILEESLGSEFFGCLGREETLTPEMDRLATEEGILFTNIYACGNRTVRGFEGVFSSFPPLPGDSIVKRDRSENVESLARVLKRDGYRTLFLYGGRGIFDGMRSYALNNGWDRFIEQKDFKDPTFATIWGVCNEDLFARGIEECRELARSGEPFFTTMLTVSNHKPYTYPRGRIPDDPEKPKPTRAKAVKYTDWCLGEFFRNVKKESFWTNTMFVVVADHGARVYGSQEIPIYSYEIPWVILGPAVVKEPQRIGTLGNSLDVAPTILGMLGRPYESMFFGRDLFNDPVDEGRVLLNHNRSIGMYADARMVVLGLKQSVKYYEGDPKVTELKPAREVGPEYIELEKDATALYQVADELYMNRLYRIDGVPAAGSSTMTARRRHLETSNIQHPTLNIRSSNERRRR